MLIHARLPLDDTATDKETLLVLYHLLNYLRPKVVVEAGTWLGHFSVVASEILPDSKIYTADTFEAGVVGPPNMQFYHGDFEAMLQTISEPIDFAFIDSGPPFVQEWEHDVRWRHYSAVKPYMAKGGLIVSHDMNSRDWNYAEEILAESSLYLPGGRGITIKQV